MRGKQIDVYKPSEDQEQQSVVEYCDIMGIPIVHIPNEGKRSAAYGAKMKRMGLRSGFPDLFVPLARGGYHGLFIEMKAEGGRATPDQKKWVDKLNSYGYRATVCVGADAAINELNQYFYGRVKQ